MSDFGDDDDVGGGYVCGSHLSCSEFIVLELHPFSQAPSCHRQIRVAMCLALVDSLLILRPWPPYIFSTTSDTLIFVGTFQVQQLLTQYF